MQNTQHPPFLHVNCENTRKTRTKMVENTLFFSGRQNIEDISEVGWVHLIYVFPGSRTGFKRLCSHILVSSKGDQTYCINNVQNFTRSSKILKISKVSIVDTKISKIQIFGFKFPFPDLLFWSENGGFPMKFTVILLRCYWKWYFHFTDSDILILLIANL